MQLLRQVRALPTALAGSHLLAKGIRARTVAGALLAAGALAGMAGESRGQTTVSAPAQTLTRTTTYTYFASGRLKTETVEPDSATAGVKLDTAHEYDAVFGNRTKSTATGWNGEVSQDRPTTTGWDPSGRFPTSTKNAKDQIEQRQYDARFGTVTKLIDANLITTKWEYDAFGRKTKELRGFANPTATTFTDYTEWRYERCADVSGGCASANGVAPVYVVTTLVKSSADAKIAPTTKTYFDRLNRELRAETEGVIGGVVKPIYQDTVYDALGRVLKTSLPYFFDAAPQWTTLSYDDLGRKRFETAPNGVATETAYSALQTTTTVHASEGDRTRVVKHNARAPPPRSSTRTAAPATSSTTRTQT